MHFMDVHRNLLVLWGSMLQVSASKVLIKIFVPNKQGTGAVIA
jgi:hypothetical protein